VRILGVAAGSSGGAAVSVDDQLIAYAPTQTLTGFCPHAMRLAMELAGCGPSDIDRVAVADRVGLIGRRLDRGGRPLPQGDALDALRSMRRQVVRVAGLDGFEGRFVADEVRPILAEVGIDIEDVRMLDGHTALADLAYRTAELDRATVITLTAERDGALAVAFDASYGQLDRTGVHAGSVAVGALLRSLARRAGLDRFDLDELIRLSSEPDPHIAERLKAVHLSGRTRWAPRLGRDRRVAAAMILEWLRDELAGVAESLYRERPTPDLILAGPLMHTPGLTTALAERTGAKVWTSPTAGVGAVAMGAAASAAGFSVRPRDLALGPLRLEPQGKPIGRAEVQAALKERGVLRWPARRGTELGGPGRPLLLTDTTLPNRLRVAAELGRGAPRPDVLLVPPSRAGDQVGALAVRWGAHRATDGGYWRAAPELAPFADGHTLAGWDLADRSFSSCLELGVSVVVYGEQALEMEAPCLSQ